MPYFALLDDALANRAVLFQNHIRSEFLRPEALDSLDACLKKGWSENLHVVLFADYEFGLPLQHLPAHTNGHLALHWFSEKHPLSDVQKWLAEHSDEAPAGLADLQNHTSKTAYTQAISLIKAAIERGDTYQINYTTRLHAQAYGNPIKLYQRLRQPVPYAALSCLPDPQRQPIWTLCFSPECFLKIAENGEIQTEPMKGTAPVLNDGQDEQRALALQADPKNRAENTMIVDLLRNDLGKIARTGSVRVPEPFKVSRFGTVWQMTSAVHAQTCPQTSAADIFRATFPCGSITGAPKRMSMQLINQLETEPRGLYTGSIGHLAPCASGLGFHGTLNVVIRTLQLTPSNRSAKHYHAVYGVGSGIVWDSDSQSEYDECQWKSRFVSRLPPEFGLIETLRVENGQAPLLADHLSRLSQNARILNIPYNATHIQQTIQAAIAALPKQPHRLKISLHPDGSLQHEAAPLTNLSAPQYVTLAETRLPDTDFLRRFKTSQRAVFDRGWQDAAAAGAFDCLFFNQSGWLLEGGRSNVYLLLDGAYRTPTTDLDILDGIMRRQVIHHPELHLGGFPIIESRLTKADLLRAEKILLSNALRGVFEVSLK
ncbi:MAG: bifunctional anthranilate synthase component I family protein/class IV aminotransferase [Neisseria sp.]|uniref:bifunctional chorismate-binding protein/class IV aminotransferase n=1 Tax=Neisseria sp. TaxID=192066 RepID=UPI0026DBF072|nr:bifunctional anthranilate synthase component I family protein/class IV aminotransferase [Neisseria sp.]MDO4640848.1 bifunctional anthranilate synthase component I family protein/class IV aminotransferase [Neisseria sp.]